MFGMAVDISTKVNQTDPVGNMEICADLIRIKNELDFGVEHEPCETYTDRHLHLELEERTP